MKKAYNITELCNVFNLPSSSYYYKPVDLNKKYATMIAKMKEISIGSKYTYGKRRINKSLINDGFNIGVYKTKALMKVSDIKVIIPKKKHYYADSGVSHKYVGNLLNRDFNPTTANTSWVGDITYMPTSQGFYYLATVMDLHSRKIVGYSMSQSATAELTKIALDNAIRLTNATTKDLMFHSDQGCQ